LGRPEYVAASFPDLSGSKARMTISSEREWAERASAFLKHKLRESEVTYLELAKRLKKHGFKETEASVTNKLKRGTFPATWFLACLAALELDGVALDEI
jgi:hypothetical protein